MKAAEIESAADEERTMKALRALTLADVKRFLAGIASQIDAEPELLRDAVAGILDKVVLDPASMEAVITYKLASLTGSKVASPRRNEFIPGFEHRSSVMIQHRRRCV